MTEETPIQPEEAMQIIALGMLINGAGMLTMQQANALRVIRTLTIRNRGISPSYQEIAGYLDIKKPSAFVLVKYLERKGMIEKKGVCRSIQITDKGNKFLEQWG